MGYLVFFSPKLVAILFADKWDIQINGIFSSEKPQKTRNGNPSSEKQQKTGKWEYQL